MKAEMTMWRDMRVKEFNEQGIISPASGRRWNISDVIEKLFARSLLNAEKSAEISYNPCVIGDFGDVDMIINIETTLQSEWTDSPSVHLYADFPIHITQNGDVLSGFFSGINNVPEEKGDWGGGFFVKTVQADKQTACNITWSFADFSAEQFKKVEGFIAALLEQRQKMEFLNSIKKS